MAWAEVCERAAFTTIEQAFMWGKQFLNPFAFEGLIENAAYLKDIAVRARQYL